MMSDREVLLRYFREQIEPITADKRGIVLPRSSLRRLRFVLDAARNEVEFKCEGDMLYADTDSTGTITVRLNSESEDPWPIKAQGGVQGIPIRSILVTHAAQAGKILNLWYGYRARFLAPSQDIASIGSIINPISIAGVAHTLAAKQVTNASQQIFAANAARKYLFVQNQDPVTTLYVRGDGTAATADNGSAKLQPGAVWEPMPAPTGEVRGIMDAASAVNNVHAIEG